MINVRFFENRAPGHHMKKKLSRLRHRMFVSITYCTVVRREMNYVLSEDARKRYANGANMTPRYFDERRFDDELIDRQTFRLSATRDVITTNMFN